MKSRKTQLLTSVAIILMLGGAAAATASTSTLLLPSFEVDVTGQGETTFVSLVNPSAGSVDVEMTVRSNWGIEVLVAGVELGAHEARTMNLADWLVRGKLPDRNLSAEEAENARAALTGRPSPRSGFYYGSGPARDRANGSLVVTATGTDTLFGDFQVLDLAGERVRGDLLLHTSTALGSSDTLGRRHGLRFFNGGALGLETEVAIYVPSSKRPSEQAELDERQRIQGRLVAYRQNGELLADRQMSFQPLEILKISDLGLDTVAGWIEVTTAEETFLTVQYSSFDRLSFGLRSVVLPCQEEAANLRSPAIHVDTTIGGQPAEEDPVLALISGQPVSWTYTVTNTGETPLFWVRMASADSSLRVFCPKQSLTVGESMSCSGRSVANDGWYANAVTVSAAADPGDGNAVWVHSSDTGYYHGLHVDFP